jgi:acetyltransferase-like isoleucine patch superfamily enzyme
VLAARATLERNVTLGARVKVGIGSVLGGDPQDLKFRGEETWVEVGDGTTIREFATINRGTTHSYKTTVGRNCLIMSYVHLGARLPRRRPRHHLERVAVRGPRHGGGPRRHLRAVRVSTSSCASDATRTSAGARAWPRTSRRS